MCRAALPLRLSGLLHGGVATENLTSITIVLTCEQAGRPELCFPDTIHNGLLSASTAVAAVGTYAPCNRAV